MVKMLKNFPSRTRPGRSGARAAGLLGGLALCGALAGCKDRTPPAASPGSGSATAAADKAPPGAPGLAPDLEVVLIGSEHDSLSGARQGLEAALALPSGPDGTDIPLPFPRVERHGDRFRVVLARGKYAAVQALAAALSQGGHPPSVLPAGQAGGDDVVTMGVVCTGGEPAPLYERKGPLPKTGLPREIARLRPGQVIVPAEDDGDGAHGEDDPESRGKDADHTAERGFLVALQPQEGLVRGPDVLLPADCTPRDEDNDDGNGRLLLHGRLCLTTRFSGRKGQVPHADLVAVTANYRRCVRFPGAGTFDGFDHNATGMQFAVETSTPPAAPAAPAAQAAPAAPPASAPLTTLAIYAVQDSGAITPRGQFPGLARPAYLDDHLIAAMDDRPEQGLVIFDGLGRRDLRDTAPIAAPRTLWSFPPGQSPRLVPKVPIYRPAAPTLHEDRVRVSFHQACRPDAEKRVRAAAGKDFLQCVMEVVVDVGLDGSKPQKSCQVDNAERSLDEPIKIPCP